MKSKIYLILFALFAFSCSSDSSSDDGNNNSVFGWTIILLEIITMGEIIILEILY